MAVATPGKSLFDRLTDPRIQLGEPARLTDPVPDWLVFPCSQNLGFLDRVAELPLASWLRSAPAGARVLMDASGEGKTHIPEFTQKLHGFLASMGAGPGVGVYVTQDRTFREDYLAYCAANGIPPLLQVITYDYYIRRLFSEFDPASPELFEHRLAAYLARPAHRARRFVSLNLTPRPTKVLFLLRLLRDGLWSSGHISFGGFKRLKYTNSGSTFDRWRITLIKLRGFRDLSEQLLPLIPELDSFGEVLFGDIPRHEDSGEILNDPIHHAALTEYDSSWFTIVPESEMLNRPVRITEKPFKALLNFHPLIMLGNPGSLQAIRDLGFSTFEGFFDERYDEEEDPRTRFDMVYAEVARLCALDEPALARLEQGISERVVHNCRWGLTGLPARFRDEIDVALVDQILDVAAA